MYTRSQARRTIVDQHYPLALPEKAEPSAEGDNQDGVRAAVAPASVLCATITISNSDKSRVPDAETSGRIILREWQAIGQQGVFVGSTPIAAGEILGVLEGVVIRRRRLTRAERRRFVGVCVNGRAAHIDVQGRWPEKVNHGPPSRSNADWDPETRLIKATKDIPPGQQVLFDYGVGYWVDELFNREYDKLPKDQRTFFDTMHAVVDNYAWLSHTTRHRRLSQAMRIGIIAFFLAQQCSEIHSADSSLMLDGVASRTVVSVQSRNALAQYLSNWGLNIQPIQTLLVRSNESANEVNKASTPSDTNATPRPGGPVVDATCCRETSETETRRSKTEKDTQN